MKKGKCRGCGNYRATKFYRIIGFIGKIGMIGKPVVGITQVFGLCAFCRRAVRIGDHTNLTKRELSVVLSHG